VVSKKVGPTCYYLFPTSEYFRRPWLLSCFYRFFSFS